MKRKILITVIITMLLTSAISFAGPNDTSHLFFNNHTIYEMFGNYYTSFLTNAKKDQMVRVWYYNNNPNSDMLIDVQIPNYNTTILEEDIIIKSKTGRSIEFYPGVFDEFLIFITPAKDASDKRITGTLSVRGSKFILSDQNKVLKNPTSDFNKLTVFNTFKLYGGYRHNEHYSTFEIPYKDNPKRLSKINVSLDNTSNTETKVTIYEDIGEGLDKARPLGSGTIAANTKGTIIGKPFHRDFFSPGHYFVRYEKKDSKLEKSGISKITIEK